MLGHRKLKSVEQYGRRYVDEYLAVAKSRHGVITSDPLEGLAFLLGKAFMRGRRDAVSIAFRDHALEVLRTYGALDDIDLDDLEAELTENGVNNRHDRRMVRESIVFSRNELQAHDGNVFNWAVDLTQSGRAAEAYRILNRIHAIKDKIATFYLRDVAFVEHLEDRIQPEDYRYFQPVDTWVERVAESLGLIDPDDRGLKLVVRNKLIAACTEADVSPLLFNAGAWMVGAHAYRLLLERL